MKTRALPLPLPFLTIPSLPWGEIGLGLLMLFLLA